MLQNKIKINSSKQLIIKYIFFVIIFSAVIGIFSIIMAGIASIRNDVSSNNYSEVGRIYNGPLEQSAPSLNKIVSDSSLYKENQLTDSLAQTYVDNTSLVSTSAEVQLFADFVKKGLQLQPSYKTEFSGIYILQNNLDKESLISFVFPLPINTDTNEISNAKLIVNGFEVKDAKTKILSNTESYEYYDSYSYQTDGLIWEGKIPAKSQMTIEAKYNTVGLSVFTYQGIENSKGSQDFNFTMQINGTRSYDVVEGLSVDEREFGANFVKLSWNKEDLYSRPLINVAVGEKLNPSVKVSRAYLTMAPVYFVFISILLYLAYSFGKKLQVFDIFLITLLFTIYFPLIHYLSSFTVDPTLEVFSFLDNVKYFSMPLYGAFLIALLMIGGLIYYFLGKTSGFKFATKFGIPTLVLFIGFFPLVVTIPEYSMLLVIIGVIALLAIILQVRVNMLKRANYKKE